MNKKKVVKQEDVEAKVDDEAAEDDGEGEEYEEGPNDGLDDVNAEVGAA
jgi:hypothetical protein